MLNRPLSIVTWNLLKNAGAKLVSAMSSSLMPDMFFLQETKKPDLDGSVAWQSVPHHDRGSAVVSREGKINPWTIPDYEGWVVGGELLGSGFESADRPLFVFSVHAPTSNPTRPRRSYVLEVESILDFLGTKLPPDSDIILGGDFNFKSLGHRVEGEDIPTLGTERRALNRFSEIGLTSCWAASHVNQPLGQTLRWSNDKTRAYHCDGIFVPSRWSAAIICEILTSSCFEISDHNPMIAWIQS